MIKLLHTLLIVSGNSKLSVLTVLNTPATILMKKSLRKLCSFCHCHIYMNAEKNSAIQYIELHSLKHCPLEAAQWGIGLHCCLTAKSWAQISPGLGAFCVEFASFLQIHQPPPQSRNWNAVTQLTLAMNVSVNSCLSHMYEWLFVPYVSPVSWTIVHGLLCFSNKGSWDNGSWKMSAWLYSAA